MLDAFQLALYHIGQWSQQLVIAHLDRVSPVSVAIVFVAGVATSLSPCTLSLLPLTVGYIGGYESKSTLAAAARSLWFTLGCAIALSALGLVAAGLGRIYGQIAPGWSVLMGGVAIAMGLNLMGLLAFRLPGLGTLALPAWLPPWSRALLVGLTFGLVASPCSTPVLFALLAWTSGQGQLMLGALLLLAYGLGTSVPLAIAGTFAGSIGHLLQLRQGTAWITPASGLVLIAFGVLSIVARLA